MTETKTKTFVLKQCSFESPLENGQTLQTLLKQANEKLYTPQSRREPITSDEQTVRIIGTIRSHRSFTCGDILTYENGTYQPIIIENEKDNTVSVEQMGLDEVTQRMTNQERANFIKGMLFFGVKDNHIILVSHGHRWEGFQQHINWLLQRSGILPDNNSITLSNYISFSTRKKIHNAKEITFNQVLSQKQKSENPKARRKKNQEQKYDMLVDENSARDFLTSIKTFLPSFKKRINKPLIDEALSANEIHISMQIKLVGKSEGTMLLDSIAEAAAAQEEFPAGRDFSIEIPKVGRISPDELLITDKKTVPCNNGLPRLADVYDKMVVWYQDLVGQGMIQV